MAKSILLDIDGALVDSVPELYQTTRSLWKGLYGEFPIDEPSFAAERPNITTMTEYYRIIYRMLEERGLENPQITADEMADRFRAERSVRISQKREGWLSENRIYERVSEMMEGMDSMGIAMSVVSQKNESAITELMEHHNLLKYLKIIVGIERGKNRVPQFSYALKELGINPGDTAVYDDSGKQLAVAKSMGMIPIGAPQGYAKPGELDGYPCALPGDLPALAGKLLGI